ncbi:TPA: hypothetical protein HA239_00325 [Candidatus Woesearchaeota archaeon]|nr:hypothetical protein QT06_C0001G0519 [archaeon GW2011_AR15]MBS3103830.1 hypothetical protein [Candidatus Woesearchaeota archaeon]HIH40844.1 hypothetical protein [Candidatus Woesearchaeota archaeon]
MKLEEIVDWGKEIVKNNEDAFLFLTAGFLLDSVSTYIGVRVYGIDTEINPVFRSLMHTTSPEIGLLGVHLAYLPLFIYSADIVEKGLGIKASYIMTAGGAYKYILGLLNTVALVNEAIKLYN